jgi:phage-related protein
MPHSKHVVGNIFELRIRGIQEVRLFYSIHKNMALVGHGIVKKTNKLNQSDIELAKKRISERLKTIYHI